MRGHFQSENSHRKCSFNLDLGSLFVYLTHLLISLFVVLDFVVA